MYKLTFTIGEDISLNEFDPVDWPIIPRINESVKFIALLSGEHVEIYGKVSSVVYSHPAVTGAKFEIRVFLENVRIEKP
jgi:hypothetical protein